MTDQQSSQIDDAIKASRDRGSFEGYQDKARAVRRLARGLPLARHGGNGEESHRPSVEKHPPAKKTKTTASTGEPHPASDEPTNSGSQQTGKSAPVSTVQHHSEDRPGEAPGAN